VSVTSAARRDTDDRLAFDDEKGTLMASETSDPSQAAADENSSEGADVEVSPTADSASGDAKPGGLGTDGTIPRDPNGVAAGHSDTASHFNAEEDEESA